MRDVAKLARKHAGLEKNAFVYGTLATTKRAFKIARSVAAPSWVACRSPGAVGNQRCGGRGFFALFLVRNTAIRPALPLWTPPHR
jgi:hypothetical protein